MTPYAHSAYQQAAVNAIYDQERLVVMVYEGITNFLRQARQHMEEGNKARKGEAISRVIALLTELDCALDREAGGELAGNLAGLYQWMMGRLTEANLKDDLKALGEVEGVAVQLMEGFQEAARQLAKKPEPAQDANSRKTPAVSATAGLYAPPPSSRRLNCAV